MPKLSFALLALLLVACTPGQGTAPPPYNLPYDVPPVGSFATSVGTGLIYRLPDNQLEVFLPARGSFIIDGDRVRDVVIAAPKQPTGSEIALVSTARAGCANDYYAILYGRFEPDFYRLGDCEQAMFIDTAPSDHAIIHSADGAIRYRVAGNLITPLAGRVHTPPPVPPRRPATVHMQHPATGQTSPVQRHDQPREFSIPPVGTLNVD